MSETFSKAGPVCPYCAHQHRPDEAFYFDESMVVMDCDYCDRDFAVRVYTSTSWTCRPTPGDHQ